VLSDCPRSEWTRGVHENFAVNSTLSCGSDANPAARYEWQVVRGSGFVDGQVFVVDSPGFFNVSCTAYNRLRPPDDEKCFGATLYVTRYTPSTHCMYTNTV